MSFKLCPQLQSAAGYSASCRSIETSDLQKLFVTHTSSNSAQHRVARFVCKSFPFKSLQQTLDPHVITRQVSIRPHQSVTGKSPGSDNSIFSEPMCSSQSSARTCKTMGSDCGGAGDEDDPPCVTGVNDVCDVEAAGGTSSVVCSASLTRRMYPYRAGSTEFRMYTGRALDVSVLIGGGRFACRGRTSSRNGCSLGSLGSLWFVIWQQSPGCSTDAVE